MKIIDLLNKIANKEEVPKKIKWGEFELEWEELGYHDYKFLGTGNHLLFQGFATSVLNDEVEIIEEELKPLEDLNLTRIDINKECQVYGVTKKEIILDIQTIQGYVNKIIDKINKMEDK